jgi:hypothetical protein
MRAQRYTDALDMHAQRYTDALPSKPVWKYMRITPTHICSDSNACMCACVSVFMDAVSGPTPRISTCHHT